MTPAEPTPAPAPGFFPEIDDYVVKVGGGQGGQNASEDDIAAAIRHYTDLARETTRYAVRVL